MKKDGRKFNFWLNALTIVFAAIVIIGYDVFTGGVHYLKSASFLYDVFVKICVCIGMLIVVYTFNVLVGIYRK